MAEEDRFAVDIIYGILSRLPIKSLARFRCVCKSWLKYINDPYLLTIHVKEEPTPIMFEQLECSDPPDKIKVSFLRGVRKEAVLELSYKRNENYWNLLLGSCNGLVLVSLEQDPYHTGTYQFAVINPLSKERHNLPPISIKNRKVLYLPGRCHAAGIGFDNSTNTFKTVFFILENPKIDVGHTMVHSSGMSSWRKIAQIPAYPIIGEGIFGDGRLHWLTRDQSPIKIVWFDLKTEEFGLTDPPKPIGHYYWVELNGKEGVAHNQLVDLNEEVGFANISPICIKLWILKQEEWVLHCSVDIPHDYFVCDYDMGGFRLLEQRWGHIIDLQ